LELLTDLPDISIKLKRSCGLCGFWRNCRRGQSIAGSNDFPPPVIRTHWRLVHLFISQSRGKFSSLAKVAKMDTIQPFATNPAREWAC